MAWMCSQRPYANARNSMKLCRWQALLSRAWRRCELAIAQHGIEALLALLKGDGGGEHVGSVLRVLELMHPPVCNFAGLMRVLRAGSIRPIDDRDRLHLIAIVLRTGPGDANPDLRVLVG